MADKPDLKKLVEEIFQATASFRRELSGESTLLIVFRERPLSELERSLLTRSSVM